MNEVSHTFGAAEERTTRAISHAPSAEPTTSRFQAFAATNGHRVASAARAGAGGSGERHGRGLAAAATMAARQARVPGFVHRREREGHHPGCRRHWPHGV